MLTAYFDCVGGISGDMTLAALLSLFPQVGVDPDELLIGLRTLALPAWELEIGSASKHGLAATTVEVVVGGHAAGDAPLLRLPPSDVPLKSGDHTHGQEHSRGHTHSHERVHSHEHSHEPPAPAHKPVSGHSHDHNHEASSGHTHAHEAAEEGEHGTRTFNDVAALIRASGLPAAVKEQAVAVYRRLAEAEATVHGATLETVHFHEVGAVDSIVDVVGAVYALHLLGVGRIVCSPLPTGRGFVKCAHGLMPIPPPATLELLRGCTLRPVDVEAELVTPTGAALAATLAGSFGGLPGFTVRHVGVGAGKKNLPFPNVLRVVLGEELSPRTAGPPTPSSSREATEVVLIEANIDDQSPQLYAGAMEALLEAGALDVWLAPIQMKKGRPAQTLSILCEANLREALTRIVFAETTTLGVRYSSWERVCLEREWVEVSTPYGLVRVKVGRQDGELRTATPEYEDCRRAAADSKVPVKLVQAAAAAAAWERLHPTGE